MVAGLMFGSTFLVVQRAIEKVPVASFLAVRFAFGALALWPIARRRPATEGEVRHGVLAGTVLMAGYLAQTFGLHDTTAPVSAFLTYLLVVFVPVLVAVRTRTLPTGPVVIGVVLAVAGVYLLSGGAVGGFGRGEGLTVLCALAFAVHIIVLGSVATRHDPVRFTMWQVATVAVWCAVPGLLSPGGYAFTASAWVAAVFCGVCATAIAFWCQSYAQRVVPESQAGIILLLEPVAAAVLGVIVGESLDWTGGLGAVLILAAVVVAEVVGHRPPAVGGELAAIGEPDLEPLPEAPA